MILRTTKFYGFCYADEIAEKEFFAKNFKATLFDEVLNISFELIKGLDYKAIEQEAKMFSFFELEDVYLKHKLVRFINDFPPIKKVTLLFKGKTHPVKYLKFNHKGFVIKLL